MKLNPQNGKRSSFIVATITLVAAIFLFDVQGAMIKHMGARYPVEQIAFFRNLFGILPNLLALYFMTEWRNSGRPWRIKQWKLGLGRGVLLICAQMCFYSALLHMQLATATTLAFSGPLFITLLSIPLLGHKVGRWRIFAVLIGFMGVVLVLRPGSDLFSLVAVLPIAAAFFYAISSLSTRFFSEEVPTAIISIYASVGAASVAFGLLMYFGEWAAMDSMSVWLWFIAMGSTGGCAVLCLISAYRMADPSSLSPFEYFGIPFSFILGWVFFNEKPFDSLFPGVLLIVAGGLLIMWRERKAKV